MDSKDSFANDRILIVDDNEEIHRDFRSILEKKQDLTKIRSLEARLFNRPGRPIESGFEIDSAYQGKEGLFKVQAAVRAGRPYALAFVDMRMPPSWDGLKTTENLWRADPDLEVVICTAYADYSWSQIVEQLGGSAHGLLILKKPFDNIEVKQIALALTKKWQFKKQAQAKQEELQRLIEEATVQLIQTEKLSALGELTASVAHELNQPLNSIKIITQSILMNIDDLAKNEIKDDMREIIGIVGSMSQIIEHMRIFSRRSDEITLNLLDMSELIQKALKFVKQQLDYHGIRMDLKIDSDKLEIMGDPIRLEQALHNLIANARYALEHCGKRDKLIEIKVYKSRDKNPTGPGAVVLEIRDNGVGIPEEVQDKVFNPFFTTKDPGKGTGLGLSVTNRIVEEHRGTIEMQSEEGKGTVFRIILPAREGE